MELDLTAAEREAIRARCDDAVRNSKAFFKDAEPVASLAEEFVGTPGVKVTAILIGVFSGVINLIFWQWVFATFGATDYLLRMGIPRGVTLNIPDFLAIASAAGTTWRYAHAWGVEGRLYWGRMALNAHERSDVLHSVLGELASALPGAVPDLIEFAHNHDDARPNPLIEKALGRKAPQTR